MSLAPSSVHDPAVVMPNASTGGAPASTAPVQLLFVLTDHDVWTVDIDTTLEDGPGRGLALLLHVNAKLCRFLHARSSSPDGRHVHLTEYRLQLLHILRHLSVLTAGSAAGRIDVSFVSQEAADTMLGYRTIVERRRKSDKALSLPHASTRWQDLAEGSSAAAVVRWRFIQHERELSEADAAPVRGVWTPNPMWWNDVGSREDVDARLDFLVARIAAAQGQTRSAVILPDRFWRGSMETKHVLHRTFGARMLATSWAQVLEHEQNEHPVASRLMARLPCDGGIFVLKASWADGSRGTRFDIVVPPRMTRSQLPSPPASLLAAIRDIRQTCCEARFGLQEQVRGFRQDEYRCWCLAQPNAAQQLVFRAGVTIRTRAVDAPGEPLHKHGLTGGIACASTPRSALVADLVQDLLTDSRYSAFWTQLLQHGCRAVRVDCGCRVDSSGQTVAFLSEMTAPTDAAVFTFAHESDVAPFLGEAFAEHIHAALCAPVATAASMRSADAMPV
jgi:hypothetical protein